VIELVQLVLASVVIAALPVVLLRVLLPARPF
jgi:hypothetical protein